MIEEFFLVVCCMWRQYLTEPWLICLSPWSHLFPRDWTIYARGPRHMWILWSAEDILGIYFWFDIHYKEISFIHFTWTGIKIVCLHGVWCLRGSGERDCSHLTSAGKVFDSCTAILRASPPWSRAYRARVCRPAQYLRVSVLRWRLNWSWPHFWSDFGCLCTCVIYLFLGT